MYSSPCNVIYNTLFHTVCVWCIILGEFELLCEWSITLNDRAAPDNFHYYLWHETNLIRQAHTILGIINVEYVVIDL